MLYLDTSALAKLYIAEPGSEAIEAALREHGDGVFTSIVTYPEALSVLARSLRERRISRRDYLIQKRAFLADWPGWHVIGTAQAVLGPAARLIERHGLRGFDAVHLCSALWVGDPVFACFDSRLREAASAEGLPTAPG
jgi:predicted nucleic acid-binding protein